MVCLRGRRKGSVETGIKWGQLTPPSTSGCLVLCQDGKPLNRGFTRQHFEAILQPSQKYRSHLKCTAAGLEGDVWGDMAAWCIIETLFYLRAKNESRNQTLVFKFSSAWRSEYFQTRCGINPGGFVFIDKMFLIQTILVFMMKMFVCLPPPRGSWCCRLLQ